MFGRMIGRRPNMNLADIFINDLCVPWDELNAFLALPYMVEPKLSSITRRAGGIAIGIKHQVDVKTEQNRMTGIKASTWQAQADAASIEARLMSDLADSVKHVRLGKPDRQCELHVVSRFEYKDDRFSFIRNEVVLTHATLGKFDFIQVAKAAIKFWIVDMGIGIVWDPAVLEAEANFLNAATLEFDARYCVKAERTQISFFKRGSAGDFTPFDPPEVRFAVKN